MNSANKAVACVTLALASAACVGPAKNPDYSDLDLSAFPVASQSPQPVAPSPQPQVAQVDKIDLDVLSIDLSDLSQFNLAAGPLLPPASPLLNVGAVNWPKQRHTDDIELNLGRGFKPKIHPEGILAGLLFSGAARASR